MKPPSTLLVLFSASLLVAGNTIAHPGPDMPRSRGESEGPANTFACQCTLSDSGDTIRLIRFYKTCRANGGKIKAADSSYPGITCEQADGTPKRACGMYKLEVTCNP